MSHHAPNYEHLLLSRRGLLSRIGMGFGALAFGKLIEDTNAFAASAELAQNPLAVRNPHFAPKAKRVVHLFMNGGPSHVDTFDPKPMLTKFDGKALPN